MPDQDGVLETARASFGAYDVLGYFLPGFALIACITAFEWIAARTPCTAACHPKTPIFSILSTVLSFQTQSSWLTDALVAATLLLGAYVTGHVIASVSAVLIDRVYVARGHGYPLPFLIGKDEPSQEVRDSRHFYRAMMFWLNLYLVVRYLSLPGVLPIQALVPVPISSLVPDAASRANFSFTARWLGLVIVAGVTARALTKLLSYSRPAWYADFATTKAGDIVIGSARGMLEVLSWPSRVVTGAISDAAGSSRLLDQPTRTGFLKRLEKLTGDTIGVKSSAAYWYAYIDLRRNDPAAMPPLENWLRLYSFARNLATAFYIAFLYCVFWWTAEGSTLAFASETSTAVLQTVPPVLMAASFLMLQRYYYLYADYFTKYLIRCFAVPVEKAPTGHAVSTQAHA